MCALKKPTGDRIDRRVPPTHVPADERRSSALSSPPGTSPRATVEQAINQCRELAAERGLELWTDIQPTVPARASFDDQRVRAVLLPLLKHCLRVTRQGSVGALASARGTKVIVEVIHSGPGTSMGDFERLCYEADHPLSRARRVARELGTDLVYERSHRASGMYRFRFDIQPQAPESSRRRRAEWKVHSSPVLAGRVLVVDRDGENRRLLRRQLEELGIDVNVAENATGTVDRALFEPYDIVLVGLETPSMNPYGTARVLRRGGYDRALVALTAFADAETRDHAKTAGYDELLLKPMDRLTLIELCVRHIPKRRTRLDQNSV